MFRTWAVASILASMLLAACDANFHSIFRTTPNGTGSAHSQLVYSDAKQSVSFMQMGPDNVLRACAARSPDVFSTLSTAFSGSGSVDTGKLAAALSGAGTSSEQASAFGLRTQLTQSQMELLYQLCIASLNGTLSPDQFATEMHRYQNTMVTMLAIEQVTGFAKPTVVAIGGNSSAGSADALASTQSKLDDATKKEADAKTTFDKSTADQKTAETNLTNANTALQAAKDAGKTGADLTTPQANVTTATNAKAKADQDLAAATDSYGQAKDYRASLQKLLNAQEKEINLSSGSATPVISPPPTSIDDKAAAAVASTVAALQLNQLTQTFVVDECVRYLFHPEESHYQSAGIQPPGQTVNTTPMPTTRPIGDAAPVASPRPGSTVAGAAGAPAAVSGATSQQPAPDPNLTSLQNYCVEHLRAVDDYRMAFLNHYFGCKPDGTDCKPPVQTTIVTTTTTTPNGGVAPSAPQPGGGPVPPGPAHGAPAPSGTAPGGAAPGGTSGAEPGTTITTTTTTQTPIAPGTATPALPGIANAPAPNL